MPIYDCGDPDCSECKRAFGPDRSKAIRRHEDREKELMPKNMTEAEADAIGDWKCCGCGVAMPDRVERCDCPTACCYTQSAPPGYNTSRFKKSRPDIELQKAIDRVEYYGAGRCEGTMPTPRDFDELLSHAELLIKRLRTEAYKP